MSCVSGVYNHTAQADLYDPGVLQPAVRPRADAASGGKPHLGGWVQGGEWGSARLEMSHEAPNKDAAAGHARLIQL